MRRATRGSASRAVMVGLTAICLMAGIVVAVLLWLRHDGSGGLAGLSRPEQAAVEAAKQETINIQTYRLKSFDADFSAAVGGMTPDKATQWQARKKDLKDGLTRLEQDSAATVSGGGIQSFNGKSAVVLVAADSQRVDAKGKSTTFAQNRFQVTMNLVGGKWLMDDLQAVSLS
jgi:hypothetical protein